MTGSTAMAGLAGALVVGGLLGLLAGFRPPAAKARPARRPMPSGWRVWRWFVAVALAMLVWAATGWPVAGLTAGLVCIGLPVMLASSRESARTIGRIEAMEEWTRRLSDVLTVGISLEQAIAATARTAPAPISAEVQTLAARLGARWPAEQALRSFADDIGDGTGDLVVAALILGQRRRGPGLARALSALADSVAEEVAMRRRVEADRAKPRATARAVTLITLGVACVGATNTTYVAPYASPLGQIVLAGIVAGFAGCLAWMRSMTLSQPEARVLAPAGRG